MGKSPEFLGTLTNLRPPALLWLRPLHQSLPPQFYWPQKPWCRTWPFYWFSEEIQSPQRFCDFIKFPDCAWDHWEESPCLVHGIPTNMAFAWIYYPPFPLYPFSLCPTPNGNKFVFLSPFLLRRLQSIWTITPQGSSHSLQVSQGFIHKKGKSPPRENCVHLLYDIFSISLYCGRIIWPAACSNRPSVTIFDNSNRMNETLPGRCHYRSFSQLHSFFFSTFNFPFSIANQIVERAVAISYFSCSWDCTFLINLQLYNPGTIISSCSTLCH